MTPPQDSVSDVERLRAALRDIMDHFGWRDCGPGHHHTVKGVWDDDISNGDRAGTPCGWCAKWENARHLAALAVPINKIGEDAWQDMATAPRDGSYILAVVAEHRGSQLEHQAGRLFVIRHEGVLDTYDLGWAVYPGFGGCSDHDFAGWMPAPRPSAIRRLSTSTDKGVR